MILPITLYGQPVLRKQGRPVGADMPGLQQLIDNMFETMYHASGVGLAAPQIGQDLLLFVVDAAAMAESTEDTEEQTFLKTYRRVVINPELVHESGKPWGFQEGCLSIPGIRETVHRQPDIEVRYLDQNFQPQHEQLTGLAARVFQHEYDHIRGVLFTDHLSPLRKQLLRPKLSRMAKHGAEPGYPVVLP
ncbi:MAG: peptide deformylase [Bacteroidetes bacterium]|jgi:peptide deformylase|nr:peptide deformylase [Bacteroidota bacterium]